MNMKFPLDSVDVKIVDREASDFAAPLYSTERLAINETDFAMTIDGVASYRVKDGSKISIQPHLNGDPSSVELFLSGSVLGAVLHQRGMLPFHGSSFSLNGKGILVCGRAGSGKSSVAAAFCQQGGTLISDDISPVRIEDEKVFLIPIKTRIKLWDDSLEKLGIENRDFPRIRPGMDKFYVPMEQLNHSEHVLDYIFILHTHNKNTFETVKPTGINKYNLLQTYIYRRLYLRGMPSTRKLYFTMLLNIAGGVGVFRIFRPQQSDILETMEFIRKQVLL
jgi:hypothetical protein